jgi:3-methyladenine DNA glycosylase AlkD
MLNALTKELNSLRNPEKIEVYQRFFKTGKGEYGEGDIFMGLTMPQIRSTIKNYIKIPLNNLSPLLESKVHEHRMAALIILTHKYKENPKQVYDFYLKNTKYINNWDLVDVTCPRIVGEYLKDKDRKILYKLANSKNLWEKRIGIISTMRFIKDKDFKDTIAISEILLKDSHDLIHKAVGWMLREVGKKDQEVLETFLKKHYKQMPRTMLRYSIERFEESKRQAYLKNKI